MTGPLPDPTIVPAANDQESGLMAVVYAGHMPDGPSRSIDRPARFPADAEEYVAQQAYAAMADCARKGAQIAFGSLAAGADILLAEAALAAGMRLHAVVPSSLEAFLNVSVRDFDSRKTGETGRWEARMQTILANPGVSLNILKAEDDLPDQAFAAVNEHVLALATEYAAGKVDGQASPNSPGIHAKVHALLVLAGHTAAVPTEAVGGTAHFARELQEAQISITIIDPTVPARMNASPEGSAILATNSPSMAALPPAPDLDALLPEFARLDKEAIASQQAWRRSLHRMLALFAILMIITGMELMSDHALFGTGKVLRRIAIAATILGLGVEAGLGLKPNRMHRSWVRSRSGAETLRAAAWSRLIGLPPLALDEAVEHHIKSPGLDAFAAQLAALPFKDRWQWYSTHRLRDQAAYYAHRAHKLHTLERRLLITRYTLIILAMLWGILRLVNELLENALIDPHFFHEYQVLTVAVALVSLLHVWLESTQAERLTGRYKALARTLTALAVKVETATTEAQAEHAAREGEELLFAQNEEWIGVVG